MQDLELGEILRHMHSTATTTALLCHGPIASAAALPKARDHHRIDDRAALRRNRAGRIRRLGRTLEYFRPTLDHRSSSSDHPRDGAAAAGSARRIDGTHRPGDGRSK